MTLPTLEYATVLAVGAAGVTVRVARQTGAAWVRGPLPVLVTELLSPPATAEAGAHTHPITRVAIVPGDRVLVGQVGRNRDDLIVLGRVV